MTDNVVSLRGETVAVEVNREQHSNQPEINPVLVRELERLLALAKSGDVLGLAGTYAHGDRSVSYSFAGKVGGFAMLGGLDVVRERLLREALAGHDGS